MKGSFRMAGRRGHLRAEARDLLSPIYSWEIVAPAKRDPGASEIPE
jgi:hypothetical protein